MRNKKYSEGTLLAKDVSGTYAKDLLKYIRREASPVAPFLLGNMIPPNRDEIYHLDDCTVWYGDSPLAVSSRADGSTIRERRTVVVNLVARTHSGVQVVSDKIQKSFSELKFYPFWIRSVGPVPIRKLFKRKGLKDPYPLPMKIKFFS